MRDRFSLSLPLRFSTAPCWSLYILARSPTTALPLEKVIAPLLPADGAGGQRDVIFFGFLAHDCAERKVFHGEKRHVKCARFVLLPRRSQRGWFERRGSQLRGGAFLSEVGSTGCAHSYLMASRAAEKTHAVALIAALRSSRVTWGKDK